jgi:hypothetical protein
MKRALSYKLNFVKMNINLEKYVIDQLKFMLNLFLYLFGRRVREVHEPF